MSAGSHLNRGVPSRHDCVERCCDQMNANCSSGLTFLLGCLLVQAACVRYVAAPADAVPVGADIRALLSAEGVASVITQADGEGGGLSGRMVRGEVLQLDPEKIHLSVPWVRAGSRDASRTLNQRIVIPRNDVLQIELRRTDYLKTGGLVALITVGVTAVVARSFGGNAGGSTLPGRDGRGSDNVTSGVRQPPQ